MSLETISFIEVGWVAGIFDGEGCIYVRPTSNSYLTLCMSNTDPRLIARMIAIVGGRSTTPLGRPDNRGPLNSRLYMWAVGGQKAIDILKLITPHLAGKREQAELALQYEATISARPGRGKGGRLSDHDRAERERIRLGLKVLKKVRHLPGEAAS